MKTIAASPYVRSRWLVVARVLAVVFIVLCASIFLGALVNAPAYLQQHPEIFAPEGWTAAQTLEGLAAIHLSLNTWLMIHLASQIFVAFGFCAIGTLILLRRSDDWFGLYVGVEFWLFGTQASDLQFIFGQVYPQWNAVATLLAGLAWFAFFLLFYVFPDGTFVPRWTRWLALLLPGIFAWTIIHPASASESSIPFVGLALVLAATGGWSQIFRYRHYSNALQRQQTKWVLYALLVMTIVVLAFYLPTLLSGLIDWSSGTLVFYYLFGAPFAFALSTLVPLSVGVAILRYRLWDIDIIIRKTLTYALVVGLLALVYFGSIILLQLAFATLTDTGQNEIITVVSTLVIAALFVPLRNWIQSTVDRRFYRKKYDAQKVLQDFGETVRDETDLEKLTARLVEVVNETMQPKSVSVWLNGLEEVKRRTRQ